jgi:transposase
MFIRPIKVKKNGKQHAYWSLVESYRSSSGPRQRTVAYLGELSTADRLGMQAAAENRDDHQTQLFDNTKPNWVQTDTRRIRVENLRDFGGYWLGLELIKRLKLDTFLSEALGPSRATVQWAQMIQALILCRLHCPSSELYIAEHLYPASSLEYLLGIPASKVDDNRLYRSLDALLPHKEELEVFLKNRLGTLFDIEYDLLLYDVTSTYFEGECAGNPMAQRGYSRDKRGDCKQVCIGLVVSREGIPLGHEVFDGNRNDVTTLQDIIESMEEKYGRLNRVWCLDRGMISQENIEFLKEDGRRYIVGTPRSMLKAFEQELLKDNWEAVREGLEVKCCPSPDGDETFILCRSGNRREKEKAMHERFVKRIEDGLDKITASCRKRKYKAGVIERRIGRLLQRNSRGAGLFEIRVRENKDGGVRVCWEKKESWKDWAELSEGCYLLRSNVNDWSAEDLWHAYMQLTQAEKAFRIHKSDLGIRPIWHQREDRVLSHILVCFLSYVLWSMLGRMCHQAGLGDEPRRVFDELSRIKCVDVVLPTKTGKEIRLQCVTEPSDHQKILLQRLNLNLPKRLNPFKM